MLLRTRLFLAFSLCIMVVNVDIVKHTQQLLDVFCHSGLDDSWCINATSQAADSTRLSKLQYVAEYTRARKVASLPSGNAGPVWEVTCYFQSVRGKPFMSSDVIIRFNRYAVPRVLWSCVVVSRTEI